jgi:MFS family permease
MFDVLRKNPQFRRLWIAQVVSQFGDWLSRMAVLAVIGQLGGTSAVLGVGALFALELATRLLPTTLMGPLAGPVADRVPRRLLMVASDLARAGLVLGLLLIREPEHLPFLYLLVVAQMGIAIFFSAAQSAALPSTVGRDELHAAFALSAATWSAMLSIGALFGGVLVGSIGTTGVFLLDSLTYIVSALLLIGLKLPPVPDHPESFRWIDIVLLKDLRRGLDHVRARGVLAAILAKSFWGGAGGFLVLLSIVAHERFGGGDGGEMAIEAVGAMGFAVGMLYCARGLGTGIGPILTRAVIGSSDRSLRAQIAGGFLVGAAGYALFPFTQSLPAAFACVVFAHCGGSTLWVASTTLWQKHVDDAFRGRIFALEFLGMTLTFSLGGVLAGALFDITGDIDVTLWSVCSLVAVAGLLWAAMARKLESPSPEPASPPSP